MILGIRFVSLTSAVTGSRCYEVESVEVSRKSAILAKTVSKGHDLYDSCLRPYELIESPTPMSLLVADCPRCGSRHITFDVMAQTYRYRQYRWQNWFEIFCVCRGCNCSTIFLVGLSKIEAKDQFYQRDGIVEFSGAINPFFQIERFISIRDNVSTKPPEHVEDEIKNAFTEGAACLAIECYNAAATMFRLCVDLVTRSLLPAVDSADQNTPNNKQRRDLGLRLPWLFENGLLPSDLRELAHCIKEEGNDGAHAGTLTKEDAEDLLDFTVALLERLVTEPKKLKLAEARRQARRK